MIYQATGQATALATSTRRTNSFERRATTSTSDAPRTFRIPISFVRRSVENEASPKSRTQAIKIVSAEKRKNTSPSRWAERYSASMLSSRNAYSNGIAGAKDFHSASSIRMVLSRSVGRTRTATNDSGIVYELEDVWKRAKGPMGEYSDAKLKFLITPMMRYFALFPPGYVMVIPTGSESPNSRTAASLRMTLDESANSGENPRPCTIDMPIVEMKFSSER